MNEQRLDELEQAIRDAYRWSIVALDADDATEALWRSRVTLLVVDDGRTVECHQGDTLVASMSRAEFRALARRGGHHTRCR